KEHLLTVLPAVSSLKALRRIAKPGTALKAMIGFGNPLLNGPNGRYAQLAQRARDNQRCQEAPPRSPSLGVASLIRSRGVTPIATRGLSDVETIRAQVPLPETADELCAVARDLNADAGETRLGARATEAEVKRLSASGELAKYRIVHFATHGALAGQLDPM